MSKPPILMINREKYRPVVCKVIEKVNGQPRKLEILLDDEKTHLEGGEEFLVGYFRDKSIRKGN